MIKLGMLSKSKIFVISALAVFLAVTGILLYRITVKRNYQSQVVLAQEIRKAMGTMMADLRQAQTATVTGVPADGQWHQAIGFKTPIQGNIKYALNSSGEIRRSAEGRSQAVAFYMGGLNFRRQPGDLSMLEVQVQARNAASLTSNFKIRMQE